MRKVKLPTGYRQVKCIISSGTQYVDTGVILTNLSSVKLRFQLTSNSEFSVFGSRASATSNNFTIHHTSAELVVDYRTYAANRFKATVGTNIVDVSITPTTCVIGDSSFSISGTDAFTTPDSAYIFNASGSMYTSNKGLLKLYSCCIYDGDVLIRDYIPCVSPTGAVGLYDLVTAAFFGNAGTGSFTFENLPIVELPSGYRQLESIESTGTQYLDTGITMTTANYNKLKVTIDMLQPTARYAYNGTASGQCNFCIGTSSGSIYYGNGTGEVSTGVTYDNTRRVFLYDTEAKRVSVTGLVDTTFSSLTAPTLNLNFVLCGFAAAGSFSKTSQTMWSAQIWIDNLVVRNYIPCIDPSDNIGLYDLQNGVFYGNSGTGAFIAGRKVYTEDEIQKLEYVESTGTQYVDTEFKPNQDTRVVMDFQALTSAQYPAPFGAWTSSMKDAFMVLAAADLTQFYAYYGTQRINCDAAADERHTLDANKNTFYLDGNLMCSFTAATFSCEQNLLFFAYSNAGTPSYISVIKFYSCQIYDNGFIVRDYYPATIDGAVGLWDAESGILYESATDALIAGPEVYEGPQMPQNLRVESVDAESISLAWDVAEGVTYRVYLDGYLLTEQTAGTYTGKFEPFSYITYEVTAFDGELESNPASVQSVFVPENPILYLITDRTRIDLNEVLALRKKSWNTMTAAEKEKYLFSMRGAYNSTDLNRVGSAINFVAETMRTVGYTISVDTKTDWEKSDFPTQALMAKYIDNVNTLRDAFATLPTTPDTPADMEKLTWQEANHIEQILVDLDYLLSRFALAWVYSGEIYSGEV